MTKIPAVFTAGAFLCALFCAACPVPENNVVQAAVERIEITKNREIVLPDEQYPRGGFEIWEGQSVILGAALFPEGVTGGVHWQSSGRGIVELSGFTGPEIIITGANGGRTIISVLARNHLNEVYAGAECTVIVIPFSFFKWNFAQDGWTNMAARENAFIGTIRDTIVRSGETPILADAERGGFILEGPGTLIIGSGMTTATSSPFPADPIYDQKSEFDFSSVESDDFPGGPGYEYLEGDKLKKKPWPLWKGRVRISVDYEILTGEPQLRIQVNNNTLQRDAACAINNWLVAELGSSAPAGAPNGELSGIFRGKGAAGFEPLLTDEKKDSIKDADGFDTTDDDKKIEGVLSHSFVCLALPEGKILIRSIRIESAD
jgi:hypothetical protein